MLRNFLISSLRTLKKHKLNSFISIIGLSISLASSTLIYLYVSHELTTDKGVFDQQVNFLSITQNSSSNTREVGLLTVPIMEWIKEQPGIMSTLGYRSMGEFYLKNENKIIESGVALTQSHFFDFINVPIIAGNPKTMLSKPNSIVITSDLAKKLFGDENPMNKTITLMSNVPFRFKVTGIMDTNLNSTININNLISWDSKSIEGDLFKEWYQYSMYVFAKAQPQNLDQLTDRYLKENPETNMAFNHYPAKELYFNSNHIEFMMGFNHGNTQSLWILGFVGILIVVIGLVNYMNINISLLLKRIREIGVRKALGASGRSLAVQFLMDNLIVLLISSVLSLTISDMFKIFFSDFLPGGSILLNSEVLIFILLSILGLTLISGIYPASFSSSLKLRNALKNQTNGNTKNQFSSILISIQFIITLGLLLTSGIVYSQYQFMNEKDLGYSKENIIILPIKNSDALTENANHILREIRSIPEVKSASFSTDVLGQNSTNQSYYAALPDSENVEEDGILTYYFGVDSAFIDTYDLNLIAGRDFNMNLVTDSFGIIVNEKLVNSLGIEDPVGKELKLFGQNSKNRKILGVLSDFNFQSLHKSIEPAALYIAKYNIWNVSVKFSSTNLIDFQNKLRDIWQSYDSETPFEYAFLDDRIERFYQKEKSFNWLLSCFTIICISLSLIGLFGITNYSIEQRKKEISIRKVLGATSRELVLMFNSKYTKILIVSSLIAIPSTGYLVNKWLENFAFRITNPWEYYVIAIAIMFSLIFTTVSLTSLKTAKSNPVKYLRSE